MNEGDSLRMEILRFTAALLHSISQELMRINAPVPDDRPKKKPRGIDDFLTSLDHDLSDDLNQKGGNEK